MAESSPATDGKGKRLWLPLLFLFFGLLLTATAVYQTNQQLLQERHSVLDAHATRIRSEFSLRMHRYLDVLRAYQTEYAAHPYFSDSSFLRMTDVLRVQDRIAGISAVGYMQVPASSHQDVYLVHYLHGPGLRPEESAYLLDRDPVRLEAVHRARDAGDIAVTSPVAPAWQGDSHEVNIAYLPLYRGGTVPDSVGARRADFVGAVFIALQPVEIMQSMMLEQLIPAVHAKLIFEGYQHSSPAEKERHTVFDSGTRHSTHEMVQKTISMSFAGTAWTLELGFDHLHSSSSDLWLPWAVFALGAILSLVSALLVAALQRSHEMSALSAFRDRNLRREAEAALHLRERAIEASANAIVITSATERGYPVVYVNPAFERMTGYTAGEIIGGSLRIMHGEDTGQEGVAALRTLLKEKREGNCILRNYRRNGEIYWTQVFIAPVRSETGEVTHFVASKYDITQKRLDEEKLEFQAWHDALTLLPNRHSLRNELARALNNAEQRPSFWVAFMDIDNFKLINDAVGHTSGDQALREIAERLQKALPPGDMVARRGGDEFVFILLNRDPPFDAMGTVQRIMASVSRPLELEQHRFFPTCSLGIAVYPQDGHDPETLIKHADMAMYHAKELGRNNYQFFSARLQEQALARVSLEEDLRKALAEEQFELHFQPQVRLSDGRICGAEALVRWRHPVLGLVPPSRFIPLAEETGLIVPLGGWILKRACEYAARWHRQHGMNIRTAVNLSARQFNEERLPAQINRLLNETGLPAHLLELELTETMLVDDVESANRILHTLKGLGVILALDDFGTGYSSLAQLKRFPLDVLKIDRSFVSDIHSEQSSEAITRTIIKLAHNLNMLALAEGVETVSQRTFLEDHGCDVVQGYLISPPLPAEAFEAWMEKQAAGHTL
jgi:PAS domain S-box/diguanylate cyclase (GGDEF) domain